MITHLAERKRWSVTLNNQTELHHQAHFPPLGIFHAAAGVVAGENRKRQRVILVGGRSRFILRPSEKTSVNIGSIHDCALEVNAVQHSFYFSHRTSEYVAKCHSKLLCVCMARMKRLNSLIGLNSEAHCGGLWVPLPRRFT